MKTTSFSLVFILCCCIFLTGCDTTQDDYISKYCPGSCTVIKGRLTTANGAKPLPNVSLTVTWEADSYITSGIERKKAVTQTDGAGNYELRFLVRDNELIEGRFVVEPVLDNSKFVYCNNDEIWFNFIDLTRDTTLFVNYEIPEKAFIEIQLTNTGPIQAGDQLSTLISYAYGENGQQLCNNNVLWNNATQNSFIVEVAADKPVLLKHSKVKNGVTSEVQNTLQLEAGTKEVVAIEF